MCIFETFLSLPHSVDNEVKKCGRGGGGGGGVGTLSANASLFINVQKLQKTVLLLCVSCFDLTINKSCFHLCVHERYSIDAKIELHKGLKQKN